MEVLTPESLQNLIEECVRKQTSGLVVTTTHRKARDMIDSFVENAERIHQVKDVRRCLNNAEVRFKNGSYIKIRPMTEGIRGHRANIILYEDGISDFEKSILRHQERVVVERAKADMESWRPETGFTREANRTRAAREYLECDTSGWSALDDHIKRLGELLKHFSVDCDNASNSVQTASESIDKLKNWINGDLSKQESQTEPDSEPSTELDSFLNSFRINPDK